MAQIQLFLHEQAGLKQVHFLSKTKLQPIIVPEGICCCVGDQNKVSAGQDPA